MGLFSLVGSIIGGNKQKKASKKAAAAQVAAFQEGIGEQRRQFDLTRSDFAPYLKTGTDALGGVRDYLGLNGDDALQAAMTKLQGDPYYQSLYRNGQEAVLQNASATGGIRGGNTERSLADFGQDTLASALDRKLQSLYSLAGLGEGATNSVAGFGQNTANAVTGLLGNQGQARATDILTRGGISAGMWNNVGSFLDTAVQAFLPGGGGAAALF